MIVFGIPKNPLSQAFVFLSWSHKPWRNVPTSPLSETATWLAKLRPSFVCAGAVVWKQPPPADVCTCLCLVGDLPTVIISHLPCWGWRAREFRQLANGGCWPFWSKPITEWDPLKMVTVSIWCGSIPRFIEHLKKKKKAKPQTFLFFLMLKLFLIWKAQWPMEMSVKCHQDKNLSSLGSNLGLESSSHPHISVTQNPCLIKCMLFSLSVVSDSLWPHGL